MEEYSVSYDAETIVAQLTTLLDFIDDSYTQNTFSNYSQIVSTLSMCLKYRHNYDILPYLYVYNRYKCIEKLRSVYYELNARKMQYKTNYLLK